MKHIGQETLHKVYMRRFKAYLDMNREKTGFDAAGEEERMEEGKGEENGGRKLEEETRNVEGERGKCRSLCFCFVFWAYGTDPQKSSVKEIP